MNDTPSRGVALPDHDYERTAKNNRKCKVCGTTHLTERLAEVKEMQARERPGCPQAWHGGLHVGLLVECKYEANHRGKHRNAAGELEWSGKLTEDETVMADILREAK